jgi:regulator of sirC expression with transglutaminase-like and TPR domain
MSASYAPAWEQKGLILWSAQRYGDARPALEMYLQLTPDGPKAETIRKMLDEPR